MVYYILQFAIKQTMKVLKNKSGENQWNQWLMNLGSNSWIMGKKREPEENHKMNLRNRSVSDSSVFLLVCGSEAGDF